MVVVVARWRRTKRANISSFEFVLPPRRQHQLLAPAAMTAACSSQQQAARCAPALLLPASGPLLTARHPPSSYAGALPLRLCLRSRLPSAPLCMSCSSDASVSFLNDTRTSGTFVL